MIIGFEILPLVVNTLSMLLAASLVFGVTYYLVNRFLEEQRKSSLLELKKETAKIITPVKLQAYERLTLFLDRISPDNLVLRHSKSNQTAADLRSELIRSITSEYDHNISQQIYVSNSVWSVIKGVKEQIIGIVEVCFKNSKPGDTGPELGKQILTYLMEQKEIPTQRAIELLKNELEVIL